MPTNDEALVGTGVPWSATTLFTGGVVDPKNDELLVGKIVGWRMRAFVFAGGFVMSNNVDDVVGMNVGAVVTGRVKVGDGVGGVHCVPLSETIAGDVPGEDDGKDEGAELGPVVGDAVGLSLQLKS